MYVTSRGVTNQNVRLMKYSTNEHTREGTLGTQNRNLTQKIEKLNSALGIFVIGAILVSTGLAFAIRSNAEAQAPASVNYFGNATNFGNPSVPANDEVVSIAPTTTGSGYWIATKRGHVYPFGSAEDLGSIADNVLNNISTIVPTNTGKGYWLMSDKGAVYTFGDAKFYGTAEDVGKFGHTYVAIIPSKSDEGYTLIENNGDVLTFGDGHNYGTASGQLGGDTIVDAQATASGNGYVMVSSRGAAFTFGDALFNGSIALGQFVAPATSIALTNSGNGYWILTDGGGVYSFGDAVFYGTAVENNPSDSAPSVDIATHTGGEGYWIANGKVHPKTEPKKLGGQPTTGVSGNSDNADVWSRLRNCESHGNYQTNTGNGYYGAYQFSAGTWNSMNTGYERADLAPPEVQDEAAKRLQARSGWGQWPVCSRNAGAR